MKDQSKITNSSIILARQSLIIIIFLSVIAILIAPFVIPLVFGSDFEASVNILNLILPGVIVLVVFRVLSGQLAGIGKPQYAIYVFGPALVLNILLNFLWIPAHGGIGAAWASNISYAFGTIGYWVIFSKVTGVNLLEIFKFSKADISIFVDLKKKFIS